MCNCEPKFEIDRLVPGEVPCRVCGVCGEVIEEEPMPSFRAYQNPEQEFSMDNFIITE